eukprot:365187-Chlamydomonas_euryale.AAC.11
MGEVPAPSLGLAVSCGAVGLGAALRREDTKSRRPAPSRYLMDAGFEARGLIFGAPLALALKCAFVPLRKPGKLPGEQAMMTTHMYAWGVYGQAATHASRSAQNIQGPACMVACIQHVVHAHPHAISESANPQTTCRHTTQVRLCPRSTPQSTPPTRLRCMPTMSPAGNACCW